MYCSSCGVIVVQGLSYCNSCGARLTGEKGDNAIKSSEVRPESLVWGMVAVLVFGFAAIVFLTMQLKCWGGGIGFPGAEVSGASECLNGSLVYLPALLAMAIVGGLLAERKHPAAPFILWAALIFAISVTFRSLDLALCDAYQLQGRNIGTHFVWHLLNGLALFLLLRASLEVGARKPAGFLTNEVRGPA